MQPGPEPLDAALIFAPVGALVPAALRATAPGGTVVCAGIHMSDIPSFPYADLWEERVLRSVANLTRADAEEFLALAPQVPVRTTVTPFSIGEAEDALSRLRAGAIEGAAVVLPVSSTDVVLGLAVVGGRRVGGGRADRRLHRAVAGHAPAHAEDLGLRWRLRPASRGCR